MALTQEDEDRIREIIAEERAKEPKSAPPQNAPARPARQLAPRTSRQ